MYKNQFYVTNLEVPDPRDLRKISYCNLNVYFEGALNVSTAKKGEIEILLLGYIINPLDPSQTDDAIVEDLVLRCRSKEALFRELECLSGRYVLLYKDDSDFIAFNDACALKQLYYAFLKDVVILTSAPRMFLDFYGGDLQIAPEVEEFVNLEEYMENECTWFGDKSADSRLRKVISNHFLDIKNKRTDRIPIYTEDIPSEEAVIEQAAAILQGSIKAIARRGRVLQMLTAGWESRLLLSASREIKDDIDYLVFDLSNGNPHNADVWVPKNLSRKLGLSFEVATPEKATEAFIALIERDHVLFKTWPDRIGEFQYYFNRFSDQKVIRVSGIGGGMLKSYYGYAGNDKVHAKMLYYFSGYAGKSEFVRREIEAWLPGARRYADEHRLQLLDLFHWEQKTTHWAPLWAFEQDIAIDEFCPLYNKAFLVKVLRVDPKKRVNPKPEFFHRLIRHMWEETLSEPINPSSVVRSLRWHIKNDAVLDYHKIRTKLGINALMKAVGIDRKFE